MHILVVVDVAPGAVMERVTYGDAVKAEPLTSDTAVAALPDDDAESDWVPAPVTSWMVAMAGVAMVLPIPSRT